MKQVITFLFLLLFFVGCGTQRAIVSQHTSTLNAYQYRLLDSILQDGLDHEALFTLLGNVKPMSSLVSFSFPIANTDSAGKLSSNMLNRVDHGVYFNRIATIQKAINSVNIPDIKIVITPYKATHSGKRELQLSAIRISSLDSLLKAKESFFGQFGLVPGADPALVVSTIECADRYERLRGYGYLFGYPDYAVDFFIDAFQQSDRSGKLVERNFFQIPAYAGESGYFVYAYPKSVTPSAAVDSALYYRAGEVLENYKRIRSNYLNTDSTLQSYKLLQDFFKK
jgi:hypothetical protein